MNQKDRTGPTVAIVGSGAAGTLTAVQLLRQSRGLDLTVVLIERAERFSRGIAYGTTSRRHLLNVAAAKMSALPDDDDHLLKWLGQGPAAEAKPYTFAPRMDFGEYLEDTLQEAEETSAARLKRVRGEAVELDLTTVGPVVSLSSGVSVHADRVVLAVGNLPAKNPHVSTESFYQSPRYVPDAWSDDALVEVPTDEPVLLIGTSLTAIDVVLSFRERGHTGVIHAVSRRGLVPNSHAASPPGAHPDFLPRDGTPFRLTDLVRKVRLEARIAAQEGRHWQSVIDVLRPRTQALWSVASEEDRRRFLRHFQPYWEVHRHRVAPEVGEEISRLRENGSFVTHAGRIRSYDEYPDGVRVEISARNGATKTLEVTKVINCTGPHTDVRRTSHPLLHSLLRDGRIRPGPLNLGLDTDETGALRDARGRVSGLLFTLGTHRKGHLWETIAIPEIRDQAVTIASEILRARDDTQRCGSRLAG